MRQDKLITVGKKYVDVAVPMFCDQIISGIASKRSDRGPQLEEVY